MLDQYQRVLFQIAEARRVTGINMRDGVIHQVWRQNGEQKVRVNIGLNPDGSPWLTPWLKLEDHHGAVREQRKYHKGQNVKVSTVGADLSQATVTPRGENNAHPEPDHADDYHETKQYGSYFERTGLDFFEHWTGSVNSQYQQPQDGQTETSDQGSQSQGDQNKPDPDQKGVVVVRMGAKPQQQQDQNQPWDGPEPTGGNPQKRHLTYAGNAGNAPQQNGDAVTTQFDKDTKTEHTQGNVLKKVQSPDGAPMPTPDNGQSTAKNTTVDHLQDGQILHQIKTMFGQIITTALHSNGDISHTIQDAQGNISRITQQANQVIHQMQGNNGFSVIIQKAEQILHQVGQSILQITQSGINIQTPNLNLNGQNNVSGFSSPPLQPPVNETTGTATPLLPIDIECGLTVGTGFGLLPSDVVLARFISAKLSPSAGLRA